MTSLLDSIAFVPSSEFDPDDGTDDIPVAAPTGPTCEVCGKEIPWSGRGRRPKKCDDHKTRTSGGGAPDSGAGTRSSAASKRMDARLAAVTGDLQQGLGELTGTLIGIAPVTAATIGIQGPPACVAIVRIAADHPRFLDGLEVAAKAVPFMAIGKFAAALMLAIAVDMGRVQPLGMAAEYLRVAEAAEAVGWQPPARETPDRVNDRAMVPPPRFSMN